MSLCFRCVGNTPLAAVWWPSRRRIQAPERDDILNICGFSDAVFYMAATYLSDDANRSSTRSGRPGYETRNVTGSAGSGFIPDLVQEAPGGGARASQHRRHSSGRLWRRGPPGPLSGQQDRFEEDSARLSVEANLQMVGHYDRLLKHLEANVPGVTTCWSGGMPAKLSRSRKDASSFRAVVGNTRTRSDQVSCRRATWR
jgi:hypothetical protein